VAKSPMCWAGSGYPAEDKYTALFNKAVDAYRAIQDTGTSQFATGLMVAYAMVTGDVYSNVHKQVDLAARETVASG
jgi:hypothetical protein